MRLAPAITLSLITALALSACQEDHAPIVPTPAPSASPIFATDEEALAAAADAYRAYQELSDQILADGGKNPERLKPFLVDSLYEEELTSFQEMQASNLRGVGTTSVSSVALQAYIRGSGSSPDSVVIYACIDISHTDILNVKGESLALPDRRLILPFEVSFMMSEPVGLVMSSNELWTGSDFCG